MSCSSPYAGIFLRKLIVILSFRLSLVSYIASCRRRRRSPSFKPRSLGSGSQPKTYVVLFRIIFRTTLNLLVFQAEAKKERGERNRRYEALLDEAKSKVRPSPLHFPLAFLIQVLFSFRLPSSRSRSKRATRRSNTSSAPSSPSTRASDRPSRRRPNPPSRLLPSPNRWWIPKTWRRGRSRLSLSGTRRLPASRVNSRRPRRSSRRSFASRRPSLEEPQRLPLLPLRRRLPNSPQQHLPHLQHRPP